MQKRGSFYLTKAVVFCFCPELLPDTEGEHVSRTKIEGAVLISCALLLMRNSLIVLDLCMVPIFHFLKMNWRNDSGPYSCRRSRNKNELFSINYASNISSQNSHSWKHWVRSLIILGRNLSTFARLKQQIIIVSVRIVRDSSNDYKFWFV